MSRFLALMASPFEANYLHVRSFLFRRGTYLLLALDAWLVMLEHGGRYGAGNFNVAHFAWVDALIPLPSPGLYVGLLLTAGLMAFTMALAPEATRPQKLALFGVYTMSWVISLHDSYQHHYLLSWLLLWSAFSREPALSELSVPSPRLAKAPSLGLTLSAYTCAIVYIFTAISKSSREWRSGAVLARLSRSQVRGHAAPGVLDAFCDQLGDLTGASRPEVLQWLSFGLVALQILVALGYLAAPGRDDSASRLRCALCASALVFVFAFHLGAEVSGVLDIGWFSYYMLWFGLVLLGPVWLLSVLAHTLTRCALPFAQWLAARVEMRGTAVLCAAALSLLCACAVYLDLPGTSAACVAFSLFVALSFVRKTASPASRAGGVAAALVAGAVLLVAVSASPVRFNLYRRWAGEVERLNQPEVALKLYKKAERYAPRGHSRAAKIEQLERRLELRR